jgi:hypothetical protein
MFRSTRCLVTHCMLVLIAIILSPILISAQSSAWRNLQQLKPGQQVRIVLKDARSYTGTFDQADDEAITLRAHGTDRTLSGLTVQRVETRTGGHRWRHLAIGAAIGAGAGVGIGAAFGSSNGFIKRGQAIAVAAPSAALLGAAIGAAMPSGGWKNVYTAR